MPSSGPLWLQKRSAREMRCWRCRNTWLKSLPSASRPRAFGHSVWRKKLKVTNARRGRIRERSHRCPSRKSYPHIAMVQSGKSNGRSFWYTQRIKMYDKAAALEKLGRTLGLFKDDRKMLIRQQRFDLRMVQKLGHELGEYLAALQPVVVLREHGRVPHQVVGRKSHEPAVQKIVVQLLHQLAFRPDAVEHLQQQGAQQLLRRDRGTAFARVKPRKATVQLAQHIAHKLPDLSQRMVRPHPRLRRNVRKQLPLIRKCAPHPRLH